MLLNLHTHPRQPANGPFDALLRSCTYRTSQVACGGRRKWTSIIWKDQFAWSASTKRQQHKGVALAYTAATLQSLLCEVMAVVHVVEAWPVWQRSELLCEQSLEHSNEKYWHACHRQTLLVKATEKEKGRQDKKEKSMLLGDITGASVPRSSPRSYMHMHVVHMCWQVHV